ncbi:MAG: signal recognition particle-docking protein FtsY [Candidatus Pacearchaeota archaeon]
MENNVALEVAEKIVRELKQKIVGKELLKKEVEDEIKDSFKDIIRKILISPPDLIEEIKEENLLKKKPYVLLFCGINGTGKTTTIAKIAEHLKRKKISCILAAGDTFRAASIEQLKEHGEKIGVKVIAHEYGSDPASVGFDAIKFAEKNNINCVLIDTAGRMHTQKNLLREMEKIVKVCKPNRKIFVGESITGNDAVEQVRSFDEAIGIDGIVLTKADIDEKGGTALSVGYVTKKPILYLGTGQEYEKIEPFDKEKFLEKLGL